MIITQCIKFNKKLINFSYKETKIGMTLHAKLFSSLYGNNGMEPQLHGSYLLTHALSHESWLQLDMKMNGTSCTAPTPNLSIIVGSLLPLNIQVSSFTLH